MHWRSSSISAVASSGDCMPNRFGVAITDPATSRNSCTTRLRSCRNLPADTPTQPAPRARHNSRVQAAPDAAITSKYAFLDVDDVIRKDRIVEAGRHDKYCAVHATPVDGQAALRSFGRQAATGRQCLHDRHAALQAEDPGLLHFPVDVK